MSAPQKEISPASDALPTSPDALLEKLDNLGISYDLYHHEAVYTVAESEAIDAKIPGTHCRNMFLRDKKKRMFLLTLANETQVDLKQMETILNCARLSFGSPDRLWQYLGVRPGSVCPFAVINDTEQQVPLILDEWMMQQKRINFHPLLNTMTVGLAPEGLLKFVESIGHSFQICCLNKAE
jgi:Ala-tRNA(Pro) deacylase